jgi:starch phosphorylase
VEALAAYSAEIGIDPDTIVHLGRTHPDAPEEPFGVTQFALRTSRAANGVSARHGEVAREMWQPLWPDRPVEQVPIGHVTNGVHTATWLGTPMRVLLDRHLGEGWIERVTHPETWAAVDEIGDDELWAVRREQRERLVELVRDRAPLDRLTRGEARAYVEAGARAFDPDALTIGFARRLATYKRLHLLVRNAEQIAGRLAGDRPIQIVMAGKAHPRDDEAKRTLQELFARRVNAEIAAHVVYVEDYDLSVAAQLVRGCDVWLNVPRPPLEASGTSGMKSAVNGGLQLSVLDGWWAEAYDGENGWALSGDVFDDHSAQDDRDAGELLRLLMDEVVPAFYDRDGDGVPRAWLRRVRASLQSIGPQFSASRMLRDYMTRMYDDHSS